MISESKIKHRIKIFRTVSHKHFLFSFVWCRSRVGGYTSSSWSYPARQIRKHWTAWEFSRARIMPTDLSPMMWLHKNAATGHWLVAVLPKQLHYKSVGLCWVYSPNNELIYSEVKKFVRKRYRYCRLICVLRGRISLVRHIRKRHFSHFKCTVQNR